MAWDVVSVVTKMAWDVMSGVTKTVWDVLSGVANLCGMFCPGCKKMAWDVLSRDVLSGSRIRVQTLLYVWLEGKTMREPPFLGQLCNGRKALTLTN